MATMTFREFRKMIEKDGFINTRTNSHMIYQKGGLWVSIPKHNGDIPKGEYKKLMKQAGYLERGSR